MKLSKTLDEWKALDLNLKTMKKDSINILCHWNNKQMKSRDILFCVGTSCSVALLVSFSSQSVFTNIICLCTSNGETIFITIVHISGYSVCQLPICLFGNVFINGTIRRSLYGYKNRIFIYIRPLQRLIYMSYRTHVTNIFLLKKIRRND